VLKTFAIDKNNRALLIAKVDKGDPKPVAVEGAAVKEEENSLDKSSNFLESDLDEGELGKVELKFSLKVVYLGQ
jgi:hypothetical protein